MDHFISADVDSPVAVYAAGDFDQVSLFSWLMVLKKKKINKKNEIISVTGSVGNEEAAHS